MTQDCANIEPLQRVGEVNLTTTPTGGFDASNAFKAYILIKKLRGVESYYFDETTRLKKLNRKEKE